MQPRGRPAMIKIEGVKITSFFPGRIRLKIADLVDNAALAARVERDIAAIDGIRQIEIDPQDGSVLIKYEKRRITAPDASRALLQTLRRHFPDRDFSKIEHWLEG